ncbi:dihydrofolate reductase [Salimicrobium humidisoli]|uniref:Dihydrofolate reductase n=1 Tax=Salimicrobium humidisoli TaxID=2029857 RepID=A0ABX4HS83_9BACI|nr:dihydrofolate reductase [Salimicrobium humidisoli]PBB05426.1 dihydrofolate reductase [Salimicrobium humidisoli]
MISFIFAMDNNRLIGKDNDLPWHIPNDFKFFKTKTMHSTVIMGRKTFESLGGPLPKREHIIITKDENYEAGDCTVVHSVDEIRAITSGDPEKEWFVIGGTVLFESMLGDVDRMYVTHIDHTFEGDTYFPEIDWSQWELTDKEKGARDEKNPYDYFFCIYDRK